MRIFQYWVKRFLAIVSLVISVPASAYLEFTYTSPELPLTAAFMDGYPWDIADIGLMPVGFSVSFKTPEQDLSRKPITHFFMDDFTFSFRSEHDLLYYPLRLSPASYGRVSLNRKGEILGWNLMITITELITPDTNMWAYRNINHRVDIKSQSGTGMCNCDVFTNRFHPTTWHGHWIQLVLLQFDYSAANDVGSWTIEKVPVPEPRMTLFLVIGILGLLWYRRAQRGASAGVQTAAG